MEQLHRICHHQIPYRFLLHITELILLLMAFQARAQLETMGEMDFDSVGLEAIPYNTLTDSYNIKELVQKDPDCSSVKLNVSVNLKIFAIIDLDEKMQVLTTKQAISMKWKVPKQNQQLLNQPADDSIRTLYVSSKDVCLPDITIPESLDNFVTSRLSYQLKLDLDEKTLTMFYPHMYRGVCRLEMERYPFDVQRCTVTFWSILKPVSWLDVWPSSSVITYSKYDQHNEWVITDARVDRKIEHVETEEFLGEAYTVVTYTITLRRQPLFYVLNLALPSGFAAIVACVAMFPVTNVAARHTLNRAQIGLMCLLFCSVQMLAAGKEMPVTSYVIPVISSYYTIILLVIALSTIVQSLSLSYELSDDRQQHHLKDDQIVNGDCSGATAPISNGEDGGDGKSGARCLTSHRKWHRTCRAMFRPVSSWKRRNQTFLTLFLTTILADMIWFLSYYPRFD